MSRGKAAETRSKTRPRQCRGSRGQDEAAVTLGEAKTEDFDDFLFQKVSYHKFHNCTGNLYVFQVLRLVVALSTHKQYEFYTRRKTVGIFLEAMLRVMRLRHFP